MSFHFVWPGTLQVLKECLILFKLMFIEYLICARLYIKHFACNISLGPHRKSIIPTVCVCVSVCKIRLRAINILPKVMLLMAELGFELSTFCLQGLGA